MFFKSEKQCKVCILKQWFYLFYLFLMVKVLDNNLIISNSTGPISTKISVLVDVQEGIINPTFALRSLNVVTATNLGAKSVK